MWSVKVLNARTALIHASSFLVNLGREQGGEGGGGGHQHQDYEHEHSVVKQILNSVKVSKTPHLVSE